MRLFLNIKDDVIYITSLPTGDRIIGDARFELRKGETFLGISYEDLLFLGEGPAEIQTKIKRSK